MDNSSRGLRTVLAALVASLASACAGAEPGDPSIIRSDSNGVRIVESTGPDKDLAWTFEEQSVLRDSAGEPYLFTSLGPEQVVADRGGRVYVLADRQVLRFDREGRQERTLGRRGGGPGEMQFPRSLGSHGDTLVVHDVVKEALVRWGPSLEPMGDRLLHGALLGTERIAFRSGGLWVQKSSYSDTTTTSALYADTSGGAPLHSVSLPRGAMIRFSCMGLALPKLYSPELHWSASGPRIVANVGPGYVLWMHEGARVTASVRRRVEQRAPDVDDVRLLYPKGLRMRSSIGECEAPVEEIAEKAGIAPVFPAVHGLVLLSDGTVWVARVPSRGGSHVLDVFAADGAYAGTVRGMRLPVGLMPGGDLLVPRDDLDSGGIVLARMKVTR